MTNTQATLHNLNQRFTGFVLTCSIGGTRPSRNDRGAALVEYVLLIVLIAIAVVAALRLLGAEVSGSFENPELIDELAPAPAPAPAP